MLLIEKMLLEQRKALEIINFPTSLEDDLLQLDIKLSRASHKNNFFKLRYALSFILLIAFIFNFKVIKANTLWLFTDNSSEAKHFKDVYENGKGQLLNESYEYPDGIILTVDSVFIDNKQLILLYHVSGQNMIKLTDIKNKSGSVGSPSSGMSTYIEEQNTTYSEYRYKFSPQFLSKTYSLEFERPKNLSSTLFFDPIEISFNIDYDRIITRHYEKQLNQDVTIGNYAINLTKISASPLEATIDYTIKSLDPTPPTDESPEVTISLLQDDKTLDFISSSTSTGGGFRDYFGTITLNGIDDHYKKLSLDYLELSISKTTYTDLTLSVSQEKTVLEDGIVIYLKATNNSTEIIVEASPASDCYGLNYDVLLGNELISTASSRVEYQRTIYVLEGYHDQVSLKNLRYHKKLGIVDLNMVLD